MRSIHGIKISEVVKVSQVGEARTKSTAPDSPTAGGCGPPAYENVFAAFYAIIQVNGFYRIYPSHM
jgi:hypothetical protein